MNVKEASKISGKKNLERQHDELRFSTRESVVKEVKKDGLVLPNEHNKRAFPEQGNVVPGENARYLRIVMEFNMLEPIDLKQPMQVKNRILEFMQICVDNDFKPTVASLAACLGLNRIELLRLIKGEDQYAALPTLTLSYCKKAYGSLEQLWESYMQNGKINPVSGIFLAKNNYGYVDKVEHTVDVRPTINDNELENRYLIDSDDL